MSILYPSRLPRHTPTHTPLNPLFRGLFEGSIRKKLRKLRLESELKAISGRLAALQEQKRRIIDLYASGDLSRDGDVAKNRKLDGLIKTLTRSWPTIRRCRAKRERSTRPSRSTAKGT